VFAQQDDGLNSSSDSGQEESLYKNEADLLLENKVEQAEKRNQKVIEGVAPKADTIKNITDLEQLTPFSDIAVIQKRFLPKSNRFELNPNFGLITNNAFFMTTYFQTRLAYAFTEKWALEVQAAFFMDSKQKVTKDLESEAEVATNSLLFPEMYYGASIRWSPIYGKMGSFNEGIIPFDMYFSFGGGIMDTNQEESPFAIHVGTGQIFGISKGMAFRWDLSGYFYSSEVKKSGVGGGTNTQSFTDIQLSLGMSFFFPDATYR
jgi:outer membrane beta-barrel protein